MTHVFRELVVGGVLVAPIFLYVIAALVVVLLLRPVLHVIGFSKLFSNQAIAEISLYIAISGFLTLAF
jgi:hypothetical protein